MKAIEFLDANYPVKTVFSEKADCVRYEGWTNVADRITILENELNTSINRIVGAYETHSGSVRLITREYPDGVTVYTDERYTMTEKGGYDSLITDIPGVMIYLWTADCIPLYLYDPVRHVCAMVHNGWRGICGGVTMNTLSVMQERFGTDTKDVIAAFGPCICGSCYEVTEELLTPFTEYFGSRDAERFFRKANNGRYLLDIKKALLFDLNRHGVKTEHIHDTGICSYENDSFASYRRDGESRPAGQTFSGIMLK